MKNFIYISLLMLGLFATSCTKEEVVMSNANVDAVPTWDNSSFENKGGPAAEGESQGEPDGSGDVVPSDGDITDPNNDPDGKKKKL
ncbi:MAG: hypothetical protein QNL61_00470 [Crocinitomicaceae bacterium]